MTKASTKGGFFGKALAAACSFALAASLVPAAALTAMADTAKSPIEVNVGTLDDDGSYKVFASSSFDMATLNASYENNAVVFYSASSWGVVATNQFLSLDTLLEKANLSQYWDEDARIMYSSSALGSTYKSSDFATYDAVTTQNFFPATKTGTPSSADPKAVKPGIALSAYAEMIGEAVTTNIGNTKTPKNAGELRDAMYEALRNNMQTSLTSVDSASMSSQGALPTVMNGLSMANYNSIRIAALDKVITTNAAGGITTVNLLVDGPENTSRIYGKEWADTMTLAVDNTFNDVKQTNFVLATVDNFADALAASGLAGALKCPIIMTSGSSLTPQAGKLLEKYADDLSNHHVTLYVAGGKAAISEGVVDSIKQLDTFNGQQAAGSKTTDYGFEVVRVAGKESWDTSLEIRKTMLELNTTTAGAKASSNTYGIDDVVIATSQDFQDAMSIAPFAYATGTPIVLTNNQNVLSDDAVKALTGIDADGKLDDGCNINIVGGKAVVSEQVEKQLMSYKQVYRTAGKSAYNTSNLISTLLYTDSPRFQATGKDVPGGSTPYTSVFDVATVACFATGVKYEDALAASAYCGKSGYTLSLVSNDDHYTAENFLATFSGGATGIDSAIIFGGAGIIDQATLMDIDSVL